MCVPVVMSGALLGCQLVVGSPWEGVQRPLCVIAGHPWQLVQLLNKLGRTTGEGTQHSITLLQDRAHTKFSYTRKLIAVGAVNYTDFFL